MSCTSVDRQILRRRSGIHDRLVKRHVAVRCIDFGGVRRVIQSHPLGIVLLACRGDATTLYRHFVGRRIHIDIGCINVGLQARRIHRADKLGFTSAVNHQVTQCSVGAAAVFAHSTSERHMP